MGQTDVGKLDQTLGCSLKATQEDYQVKTGVRNVVDALMPKHYDLERGN